MAKRPGIRWTRDTLTPTMAGFTLKANVAIAEIARRLAIKMKLYAQENAPWEDRTGMARAGLDSDWEYQGFKISVYLFHTVEYGIWLEIRWSGKYAIIAPTLEHFENEIWPMFDTMMLAATLGRKG